MPLPMPTPSRASRRPPTTAGNGPGNNGAPGSYSSSPNLGGAGAIFGSPRATAANTGAGVTGSPLPTSRLLTPRAAGLGGGGTPSRIPGGGAAATTRPPLSLSSHQQLQKALQGGGTGGANGGEAVKVRGSPIPAESLGPPAQVGRSKSTSKRVDKTNDEEEPEDDGYDEDEEGADDEDGDVDDDEIMEEVTLSGLLGTESVIVGGTGDKRDGLKEDGSEFFGSMEMDDNSGEKMEEDDPDPETEEVPTTDTGEVGGSTTDDGARKRRGVLHGISGLSRKTAPTPPVPGRVTRSSTRESDREREKKEKQARDKAKMPPPPPMVKRNPSTATRGGVKTSSGAAGKEGTTATSTSRIRATSTTTNNMATGGINRTTSVRKGSASKDEPSAPTGTKSRSTAEAKTSSKPTGSTAANTTRHMRTRSVASGAVPSLSSSARQNGATTGTDSEDPATSKRKAARTGLAKKPRPVSMFVSSTTKAGTGGESDGAPPSPTAAAPPIASGTRSRQPTGQSKDTASIGRKPSTRAAAGTTTIGTTAASATATITQSHRRNQSEAQLSTQQKSSRPEFTTLQKDFSAPAPPPKQYLTEAAAANAALLPDAPTLQKQTHLLQLLLLHNTAIQSFQSFHSDAHAKLSKRYDATVELYRQVRERLCADARTADMAVLSNVLSAIPVVPPIGGIARWGTASARRLSGSRDHLARGDGRRKTLAGEMASPVEERIQVLSESIKRVEGLLRKGGEVARVRASFEAWIGARMNAKGSGKGEGGEEGLPKQWHRDWATVKRKLEVAVDGVKDFWVAYQHVLNEDGNGSGGGNNNHNVNGSGSSNGASSGTGSTGSGSGGTLVRMVLGFLELGEDVIRELDDMKNLEKLWVDEARERMRKVVREVMMDHEDGDGDDGERMEGVETEGGGMESIGGGGGDSGQTGGIWRL